MGEKATLPQSLYQDPCAPIALKVVCCVLKWLPPASSRATNRRRRKKNKTWSRRGTRTASSTITNSSSKRRVAAAAVSLRLFAVFSILMRLHLFELFSIIVGQEGVSYIIIHSRCFLSCRHMLLKQVYQISSHTHKQTRIAKWCHLCFQLLLCCVCRDDNAVSSTFLGGAVLYSSLLLRSLFITAPVIIAN